MDHGTDPQRGHGRKGMHFMGVLGQYDRRFGGDAGTASGQGCADIQYRHLLRASPKSQFVAQLMGTTASCFMVKAAWLL